MAVKKSILRPTRRGQRQRIQVPARRRKHGSGNSYRDWLRWRSRPEWPLAREAGLSGVVAPVHVAIVGHGFVDQGVEVEVVILERLTGGDRMRRIVRRAVLAAGVEESEHSCSPVFHSVSDGRGALPQTLANRRGVDLL